MPNFGVPIEATNPLAQALCTGIAAPPITFRPGGVRKANIYTTEPLLQEACTTVSGMDGPFPIYLDFSLSSDFHTLLANLTLGDHSTLIGVMKAAVPPELLSGGFSLTKSPVEVRDVLITVTGAPLLAAVPPQLRLSGQTCIAAIDSASCLYAVVSPDGPPILFLDDSASIGDGTNATIKVEATGVLIVYVHSQPRPPNGGAYPIAANSISIAAGGSVQIYCDYLDQVDPSLFTLAGCTITILGPVVNLPALPGDGLWCLDSTTGVGTWKAQTALDALLNTEADFVAACGVVAAHSLSVSRFVLDGGFNVTTPGTYDPGLYSEFLARDVQGITFFPDVAMSHFPRTMASTVLYQSGTQTAAVCTGVEIISRLYDSSIVAGSSLFPFFDVSSGLVKMDLFGASSIAGASGEFVFEVPGGGGGVTLVFSLNGFSSLGVGTIGTALLAYAAANVGTLKIYVNSPSAQVLDPLLFPYIVSDQAPATTTGTTTMSQAFEGWPADTSAATGPAAIKATLKFPAAAYVGQEVCPNDVGGKILDGSGNPLYGVALAANGAPFVNPDTGALVGSAGSMNMTRNYWSQGFVFTAKGIWRLRG